MHGRGKELSYPKTQNIRSPFISKTKKEIKDRILRKIGSLETEEQKKERKKLEKKLIIY